MCESFKNRFCYNNRIFDGDRIAVGTISIKAHFLAFLSNCMNLSDCVRNEVG